MEADGALEKKLAAWIAVNDKYANAIGQYKGNLVPAVVMGGDGKAGATGSGNSVVDLISMLNAKTAMDLSLDLSTKSAQEIASR